MQITLFHFLGKGQVIVSRSLGSSLQDVGKSTRCKTAGHRRVPYLTYAGGARSGQLFSELVVLDWPTVLVNDF